LYPKPQSDEFYYHAVTLIGPSVIDADWPDGPSSSNQPLLLHTYIGSVMANKQLAYCLLALM
jgi:hypothetical protein